LVETSTATKMVNIVTADVVEIDTASTDAICIFGIGVGIALVVETSTSRTDVICISSAVEQPRW